MTTDSSGGSPTLIHRLADRLEAISRSTPSVDLQEKVVIALLDYLASISAGLKAPWASNAVRYAQHQHGPAEAHAWGQQEDTSVKSAAFVNALLAHSAIRDDMHLKSNSHIGSMVISAALAMAQRSRWTGLQIVKAVIGGYEAAAILGTAVQQSPGYNRHARPSGICGAFGAAACAVTAMDLPKDVAINALAFAANMGSGYCEWAWAGGVEIYTEMGSASQAGIDAFQLAMAGLQCSETVLEGKAGVFAALNATDGPRIFSEQLKADLGSGIMDVRFKPVPGCNYAQTPLAVALRISEKHDLSEGIRDVHVEVTSGAKQYPGCDNPGPFSNVQQTKMSIQYGVCAVLLNGNVSEEIFKQFDSQAITSLASHTAVEVSQAYAESFEAGRQPARVAVTLQDGSQIAEELPDVPWLDGSAVRNRYEEEVGALLGAEQAKTLAGELENMMSHESCSDLFKLFKQQKVS